MMSFYFAKTLDLEYAPCVTLVSEKTKGAIFMTIAEASKKYGVSADTLRYYERIGLLPPVPRNKSGIRDYDEESCRWIEMMLCMRKAGVQIEALIEYVALFRQGDATAEAYCLTPGTEIAGRYTIGRMLGLGGLGITYQAWDEKLETVMAVKEYYPSGLVNRLPGQAEVMLVASKREEEFRYGKERFLEEARNLARFNTHPNIVNVYDFFEANNTAYIVMEFLDGQTLSKFLQQSGAPLPW